MLTFKQKKLLIRIINEEIEKTLLLLEQDPNMAAGTDPNAPPVDPNAAPQSPPPAEEETPKDPEDKIKGTIEKLAGKPDEDIRKTIVSDLQDGAKEKDAKELLSYIEANKQEKDPEKKIPDNIVKVAQEIMKHFNVEPPPFNPKTPEPAPAAPPNPTTVPTGTAPPSAPPTVAESRLQKLAQEYLHYKRLYRESK